MQKTTKKNNISSLLIKIIGNEKRQSITIPLIAIFLSLLVGSIIIMVLGKNPIQVYINFLQGSGILPKDNYASYKGLITDFMSFMNVWTPMIFASLAVAVAFRAGLFNIGISGQMITAGFITSITVGYSTLSAPIAKPLVLVVGILVGALVGGIIGFLKYKFNINEVVSSIMINYIAQYVISFFINVFYVNQVSRQSEIVSEESRLTLVNKTIGNFRMDIPLGIILAVIVCFIINFLFNKTVFGYELKSMGASKTAAKYAGIGVGKTIILAMIISGALAGLAGVTYYMGYVGSIQPRVLPSLGFDAIAVSLLANNHPVGILLSSFLITIISKGGTFMSASSQLPIEIASVITGVILLFSACGVYIRYKLRKFYEYSSLKNNKEDK